MNLLIVSASLRQESRSRVMADSARRFLESGGHRVDWMDLRQYPLPLCDGTTAYEDPAVEPISQRIKHADALLVSVPIYNFYTNAAVKNLIELTGSAWEDKIVGFLCAAGGRSSYMSVMSLANSLMLDFRCIIIPRFVYGVSDDFTVRGAGEVHITNPKVEERITELAREALRLSTALAAK